MGPRRWCANVVVVVVVAATYRVGWEHDTCSGSFVRSFGACVCACMLYTLREIRNLWCIIFNYARTASALFPALASLIKCNRHSILSTRGPPYNYPRRERSRTAVRYNAEVCAMHRRHNLHESIFVWASVPVRHLPQSHMCQPINIHTQTHICYVECRRRGVCV